MDEDVKECNSQVVKRYKRFLKDNGIYKRVMSRHLENAKKKNLTLEEFFDHCNKMTLISDIGSFCTWSATDEGKAFWWAISNKWKYVFIKEFGNTTSTFVIRGTCIVIKDFLNRHSCEISQQCFNEMDYMFDDLKKLYENKTGGKLRI